MKHKLLYRLGIRHSVNPHKWKQINDDDNNNNNNNNNDNNNNNNNNNSY